MTQPPTCPKCSTILALDAAEGLCPRCLLETGLGDLLEPERRNIEADNAARGGAALSPRQYATQTDDTAADISLDFLDPSDNPEHLGKLAQYEIIEVIGRGGMGVVLRAEDTRLNRIVAIKTLAPELASNSTARKRFLREGQAAAAVSHDHVVTIHAVEDAERVPFLVLEFIDGPSLGQKIDETGPLEIKEILRIGMQAAAGLAAAHRQGLVHRDIKPSNILLENSVERVKITDFGLARAVDDIGMTKSGQITGTPEYMSPEQALSQVIDHRSDLFSLGSVLYAMCTGRSPFRADSSVAILRRVCDDTPRPIREINPDTPAWLIEVIDRLLAKNPDERFQSAEELSELLSDCLAHLQQPDQTPRPVVPRTLRTSVLHRRWSVAAAVLVLLTMSLGVTEATGVTELTSTVIRIVTGEGTLVLNIDDPSVNVSIDGESVSIKGAGVEELRLRPGNYQFSATKDGKPIKTELVTITRGGRRVVEVTLESATTGAAVAKSTSQESLTEVRRFAGHKSIVNDVMFADAGKRLISGSQDKSVRIWDTDSGRSLRKYESGSAISLAITPDERFLIVGSYQGIEIWDLHTDEKVREIKGHEHLVTAVTCSPDGRSLLASDFEGTVHLWDFETGEELRRFDCRSDRARGSALAPDGRIAVLLDNTDVVGWNPEDSTEIWREPGRRRGISAVAISSDGRRAVTGDRGGSVLIWDVATGRLIRQFSAHPDDIKAVCFTPDGRHVVSGSIGGSLQVREVATGREIASAAIPDSIFAIDVSPDGQWLLTAGGQVKGGEGIGGHDIRLWQLPRSVWPIDQTVAKWVLQIGGSVGIGEDLFHDEKDLPDGLFQLNEVDLRDNSRVTDEDLRRLPGLAGLRKLWLSNTRITDSGLKHIESLTELRLLWLDGTQVTDAGLQHLRALTHLHNLNLDHTQISDEGLQYLRGLTQLYQLRFIGAKRVTNDGLEHLRALPQMETLFLDHTEISGAGLAHLAEFDRLEHIALAATKTGDSCLERLRNLQSLIAINLEGTPITDEGLKHLSALKRVEWLVLAHTQVGDDGLKHVVELENLKELWLQNTSVTDAGLEYLKQLSKLTTLRLEETKVTDQGVAALKAALPDCEITR